MMKMDNVDKVLNELKELREFVRDISRKSYYILIRDCEILFTASSLDDVKNYKKINNHRWSKIIKVIGYEDE